MAVEASLFEDRGYVTLDLRLGEYVERIEDDPDVPNWHSHIMLEWDAPKLERGEREFVSAVVLRIADVPEEDFAALDQLDLPRVDCPRAGLKDATVADVLRWAKRAYARSPEVTGSGRV